MSRRLAHTSEHDLRASTSTPAWAKFAVGGGTLAVVMGAVFLMAVRGRGSARGPVGSRWPHLVFLNSIAFTRIRLDSAMPVVLRTLCVLALLLGTGLGQPASAQDLKTVAKKASFDDVKFELSNAIIERGLKVDFSGSISQMLDRTGADVGSDATGLQARRVHVVLLREAVAADDGGRPRQRGLLSLHRFHLRDGGRTGRDRRRLPAFSSAGQ